MRTFIPNMVSSMRGVYKAKSIGPTNQNAIELANANVFDGVFSIDRLSTLWNDLVAWILGFGDWSYILFFV